MFMRARRSLRLLPSPERAVVGLRPTPLPFRPSSDCSFRYFWFWWGDEVTLDEVERIAI